MEEEVDTESIIEAVKAHPYLYDSKDPKYTDKLYKDLVWDKISKNIGLPVKDCKVRWKSLRDRYRREKLSEKRPSQVKWKYKPHLEFLAEALRPMVYVKMVKEPNKSPVAHLSRKKRIEEKPSVSCQEIEWEYNDNSEHFTKTEDQNITIENISEINWIPIDEPTTSHVAGRNNKNDNRKSYMRKYDSLFHEVLIAMKRKYEAPESNTTVDKLGSFIAMMCEKMDKLTPCEVDDVQIEILQLLNRKINKQN